MAAEESKTVKPAKKPPTGEEYLFALIKCAAWVSAAYKTLADKHKADIDFLKELYLCACDNVPIEKVIEAQGKKPEEGVLRFLRRKHIEAEATSEYTDELTEVKQQAAALEREVHQMTQKVEQIEAHVPDMDAMFPDQEQIPPLTKSEKNEKTLFDDVVQPNRRIRADASKDVSVSVTDIGQQTEKSVPESGTRSKCSGSRNHWLEQNLPECIMRGYKWWITRRKGNVSGYIEKLIEEEYSIEQINYLLDCIEDGMPIHDIKRIASSKIPVEVMQRLKIMLERSK